MIGRVFTAAVLFAFAATGQTIWIEGEDAAEHSMIRHGWYDSVQKAQLSGEEWLPHFSQEGPGEALYRLEAPEDGGYRFWLRANPIAGAALSYKLDDGQWTSIDMGKALQTTNIAADAKPDMRFVGWVEVGDLQLSQGEHTLRFRTTSDNHYHGAIDAFVLTQEPFQPRGAMKPGERSGKANEGFFAWEPPVDPFTEDALVDLRELNEETAGQGGRVHAEGNRFVLGGGSPVRFWGVNIGPDIVRMGHDTHELLARTLAKRGVNLVRIHGGIYSQTDPAVDMAYLDNLHHMVAALKEQGIYTAISFYFPAWFKLDEWHQEQNKWNFMLLFFDPQMQRIYFNWAEKLLTTPNPYTEQPLAKDPAVAMVEVQNEDSHLFWTFGPESVPPDRWEHLTRMYAQWLKAKHGSLEAAYEAWGGVREEADAPEEGRMHLLPAWHMTREGLKARPNTHARMSDQVQFLTENMRAFYEMAIERVEGHGYGGLISCGNWKTSDPSVLGPLERYAYTAGDVIDSHGYFDPQHEGEAASWDVRAGHTFQSRSVLKLEGANPLTYVEVEGYPHIISEIGWPMPNMYRAEENFLTAAYGLLQGLDGVMHFAINDSTWAQGVHKFVQSNPVGLGGFPAPALVYRKGYVKEGPVVAGEAMALEELYQLEGTRVYAQPALDQLRADQAQETAAAGEGSFNPLSFYVGRVLWRFGGEPVKGTPLSHYVEREDKVVSSATRQLQWNYEAGVATMNAPAAKGAVGFLRDYGPIVLDGVEIEMDNGYGAVWLVSMDDKPLAQSGKLLIQCMTMDQPYGWETSEPGGLGGEIKSTGGAPWGVQKIQARVLFMDLNARSLKVTSCDENGYAVGVRRIDISRNEVAKVEIEPTEVYTVIQTEQ